MLLIHFLGALTRSLHLGWSLPTSRYIDDILTVNSDLMATAYRDIYPHSLPLNFDDTSDGTGHFLDLHINRNNGDISLYDKRRDFSFKVIRLTDPKSNNPRKNGLTVLFSQIIRITRVSSTATGMKRDLAQLVSAVRERGYSTDEIARTFYKLNNSYPTALKRFGLGTKTSVRAWLNTEFNN